MCYDARKSLFWLDLLGVHLVIPEEAASLLESHKQELTSIIGIGKSGISDVSRGHDQYIY